MNGLPPNRIDFLTGVTGLVFASAWANRVEGELEGVRVPILSYQDLVANKRATGRARDLADVKGLEGRS